MEGIVIQLQKEALDENVDIEILLRKAYLVARKLHLKEFEEWISFEQNGYKDNVPDYRIIGGVTKAWNPYHGWIPIVFDGNTQDIFNKWPMGLPIAAICEAYKNSKGSIRGNVPSAWTEYLNKYNPAFMTNYIFESSKSELHKILSAVRNRILDWSLLLEENGIIGEDLTFTETEIKTAAKSSVINNYTNNFYSATDNIEIQQGGNIND